MISVWDAQTRLSIAARASKDKNEVKATLDALKSLDLKGCIVTADALHCHPKMAAGVRAQGGHYALKLKGNNGPLHARAPALWRIAMLMVCRACSPQRTAVNWVYPRNLTAPGSYISRSASLPH
jgi:hypothetical protein